MSECDVALEGTLRGRGRVRVTWVHEAFANETRSELKIVKKYI